MNDDFATAGDFPVGLLNWSGHRGGGVKRPFHRESGRPSGAHVETGVTHRLRRWVDDLLSSPENTPTAVLLVGGPGNGKTDAIEVLVEWLDERLGANGRIIAECSSVYAGSGDELAPRKARLDLSELGRELPVGVPRHLCIVQDASEDPRQPGSSRGGLLASELLQCQRHPDEAVYICCANRGVVSEALSAAKLDIALSDAVPLLEELLESVTSGPKDISCWPLPSCPRIAAWPMDVDSLTAQVGPSQAVCRGFISVAVDETRWPKSCPAGSKCPICENRKVLSTEEGASSLCTLLRYFELAAGRRWTFRDLFSLIPHVIVGDDREYVTAARDQQPCLWAADQAAKAAQSSPESMKAKLNLVARLYQHRLFPMWPTFRGESHQRAVREVVSVDAKELAPVIGLMRWLGGRHHSPETDVARLLATSWSEVLDPALASGSPLLVETRRRSFSVKEVEERFSLSVLDGLELVRLHVSELERDVLRELAVSDAFLTGPEFPRRFASSARIIQQIARQFCCRLVKRSIGARRGICKGLERLREYECASSDTSGLRDFRKSLMELLHDNRNRFSASLATTFGQPAPYQNRDVRLVTGKVAVRTIQRHSSAARPVDPIPYVRIGRYVVPVNLELFSSIADRETGLRAASLPPAVFALFDTTRSIVTGETCRDPGVLEDEIQIEIGGSSESIIIEAGRYSVIARGEADVG